MAGWTGKRVNVTYIKGDEPSFLKKFKERVGYKEDDQINGKFEDLPAATEEDLADQDDELPQIVQLKDGDLSKEEFDKLTGSTKLDDEKDDDGDGKILFKKPTKRSSEDGSGVNILSTKKHKKDKAGKDKKKGQSLSNKKLLSFDEDDEDDT